MAQLISWNVNGIRAAEKKGLFDYLQDHKPDILSLQETKANPDQLSDVFSEQPGYHAYFASAARKGYSGVAIYSRIKPLSVDVFGHERFDSEGRVLAAEYDDFVLINAYFPNSQAEGKRLDYKLDFCDTMLSYMNTIVDQGKHVIVCGDFNIAHKPIDLARPAQNEGNPGYLPEERAWFDTLVEAGYLDTFREFDSSAEQYSWWSYRMQARAKNIGWRLDYHVIDPGFRSSVSGAGIQQHILGSDHCPVTLELSDTSLDTDVRGEAGT